MATFIAVPLKKTYEVDLVKPLKNLISSSYNTADNPEDYTEPLNELNKSRNNAAWKTLDRHESSLEVVYRYYDQLNALEAKVPPQDIQIPFKWKDAFDKGSFFGGRVSLTVASLAYEKVCILFNIAALQSQVASDQNLDNDEGLKLAAKLFQLSSGVYSHLKTNVMSSIQQEPTPDIQPEALGALASLMIAQAQECLFCKATHDNMKDAIIAKVAAQCEDLYAEAMRQMQRDSVRTLWDKDWLPLVAGKQTQYHALAEYHQSLVAKSQKNVGEELARLTHAMELIKSAESRAGLTINVRDISNRMQRSYDEAKKDNDFIYHERVPDIKSLPAIGKAALAKPLPLPDQLSANFKDLFAALVPVPVHQAMAAFDVRRTEIVNTEIGKLREQTQLMNSILASLNLPAALEDMSGDNVPASLVEKAKAMRDLNGIEGIEKLISELPELLQRNKEILDEGERMLNDEQQSDTQLKAQFKERWTRTASEKLTEPMRVNASKYRQIINTAMQADGVVREKFNTHKNGIILLSKSQKELQSAMPSANPTKALQSSSIVTTLRNLMERVETIKAERDAIEAELKNATVDIRSRLLSDLSRDGAINEPVVSGEVLGQVYGPLQKQVRESVGKQEQLLGEIQVTNTEFCKEKNNNQSAAKRESMLKELAAAYDAYMELTANLQEGTKFYNDLTQLLLNFQNKVSDFCFARKTEKEELMRDLQQTIANQPGPAAPMAPAHHAAANTSQPKQVPSRPPPPTPVPVPRTSSAPPPGAPQSSAPPQYAPLPMAGAAAGPGAPPMSGGGGAMPYPVQPQGMPMPQPYNPYPYASYTYPPPVPGGYNPYAAPYPNPGYGYPPQQPPPPQYGYPSGQPNAPYPQQPQQQQQQWH